LGSLPAGGSAIVQILARASGAGLLTNVAAVQGARWDVSPENNTATEVTLVAVPSTWPSPSWPPLMWW